MFYTSPDGIIAMPESTAASTSDTPVGIRPAGQKRSQVARACNACRTHRSKCDNGYPCRSCESRGTQCSNIDAARVSTLPIAQREIQRLRRQVQDLQQELRRGRDKACPVDPHNLTPIAAPSQVSQVSNFDLETANVKKKFRDGIHIRTARSQHETWYGPSSLFYFIRQVTTSLSSSLQQNLSAANTLPNGVTKLLHGPTSLPEEAHDGDQTTASKESITTGTYLSPTQEEYFLDLFWQSYHTSLFPILDESEFREHYRSLWVGSGATRNPSALADIVVAISMQYGISMVPATKQGGIVENNDATIAGRWYYRRCQILLAYEMESPSLSTMQSHLLSCVYLCCGTFQNMADSTCGLAVRTAYMLGLHLEPPSTMSLRDREIRKRVWWSLYVLDSKIGMKLGRPFLLHDSHATPSLPGDSHDAAAVSGSSFALLGDNFTWLSFNVQHIKLFQIARAAHTDFYDQNLSSGDNQTSLDDIQSVETFAELVTPCIRLFEEWADCVPNVLKTKRQSNGRSFSTDTSVLEIEQFAPLWLQRQRLMLELMYHNLCTNLYRPFIRFTSTSGSSSLAQKAAMRCAAHATALTHITHQVLSSTSILDGWHEAFQWQWNAAMTLVGFVLAYPQGTSTPAARSAMDLSIAVFDMFGNNFAVAASAANIIRDLSMKVDLLAEQSWAKLNTVCSVGSAGISTDTNSMGKDLSTMNFIDSGFDFDGFDAVSNQDTFAMALAVDLWGDHDTLWPNTGGTLLQYRVMA